MPRCQGRPNAPCPEGRNDSSVRNSQGDLFLCKACDEFRFPVTASDTTTTSTSVIDGVVDKTREVGLSAGSGNVAAGDEQSTTTNTPLIVSELLFFVNSVYDSHPAALIKSTVGDFFREDEVLTAKSILIDAVSKISGLSIQAHIKNRIGVNKTRTSLDDIMNIFAAADEAGKRSNFPTFCAVDRKRIPVLESEMSDIAALRHEVSQLKQFVESFSEGLGLAGLYHELNTLQQQVNDISKQMLAVADRSPSQQSGTVSYGVEICNEATVLTATTSKSNADVGISPQDASTDEQPPQHKPSVAAVGPVYADALKRDTDSGWQTVKTGKRKPRNKIVIGESKSSCTFLGVSKKSVVCVNRLHPSTTAEMVSDFLQSKGIDVISCFCSTETSKPSVIT